MKKILFFSVMVFSAFLTKGQCSSIYGLVYSSNFSLVSVDKYTGGCLNKCTISSMTSLISSSSTIETDSNRYVCLGLDASMNQHIYSIDFNTNRILYQPIIPVNFNDSNFFDVYYDVKQKKIFAIMEDESINSTFQFTLVTINPCNGKITILDSITGMRNVVAESSTIGIDSGSFYIVGLDNISNQWLYVLDDATGHLKYKVHENAKFYEFQYDTVSKLIYGVHQIGSSTYKWIFSSLNPLTGILTDIDTIPGMQNLSANSSGFAQDSLNYFVVGLSSHEQFYSIHATSGNVLEMPTLGSGSIVYQGTEYDPCGSSYCTNIYSEPICIATVDTATNKAEVIWGRTNSPPATGSYNIYKDTTSGFTLIDNQPLNSLSEYIDQNSYPSDGPESYKLSTLDSCGESVLSPVHSTIYLTTTIALNVFILNWTAYVGFTPSKYRIFRGASMSTLVQIDSVPNTILNYHDTLPPLGSIYLVEAVNPSSICIPTTSIKSHTISSLLSGSLSNGFNTTVLGVQRLQNSICNLNVYPNPGNGMVNIEWSVISGHPDSYRESEVRISILNELGQIVYENKITQVNGSNKQQLNLENLSSGIYTLRLQTNTGSTVKKLVMMRNK
jgi:hypothetical protein